MRRFHAIAIDKKIYTARKGGGIDFVKKHTLPKLDAKRRPVQESQLFMTTRARLSSVLFTRAISSRAIREKLSEDSVSLSFPFVLSRERITIVREAIRARPRLALRASEISQNYAVISGGDINTRKHVRARAHIHTAAVFPRERHLCDGGGYEDTRAPLGITASSSPPPCSLGEHFHKLPHKAYSHPVVRLTAIGAEWIRWH